MIRRLLVVLLLLVAGAACGDDDPAPPPRTVGILRTIPNPRADAEAAFRNELAAAGWIEGENLTLLGGAPDEAHPEDAEETVRAWVDAGVDLIVALSTSAAQAADEAADEVPVLFLVNDPVAVGLVEDEREPDGDLTGVTYRVPADRTLDVALRALGPVPVLGVLWPSEDPAAEPVREDLRRAARDLGIDLVDEPFAAEEDVPAAVDRLVAAGAGSILLANAPTTLRAIDAIAAAADRHGVALVANTRLDQVVVALAPDSLRLYRQLGRQAVRLLSGAEVAEVPVEDPGGFRIVVNRDVARRAGIEVPQDLLELADEVNG